jgi:AI-2 transport protein TqsA
MEPGEAGTEMASSRRAVRLRRDLSPLFAVAAALFIAVGSWYLLKELAPLLRPLVFAGFLTYTILPARQVLRERVHGMLGRLLVALVVAMVLVWLALLIYGNLVDLNARLPQLVERAQTLFEQARNWAHAYLPKWAFAESSDRKLAEAETAARLRALASTLVSAASSFLAEAVLVALYLIFILLDVRFLPERIRSSFPVEQAERTLATIGSINHAISSYLRAKTSASLLTALPYLVVLWAFGVSFPAMWAVVAFIGNFIPYVGSLVALVLPILLAFLELEPIWRPILVLALLVSAHFVMNNFIEPRLTARAVDLSPLVVLIALAFWGLCWGVVGMVLAIPLTVVLKIVWEAIPLTRPLARLMAEK